MEEILFGAFVITLGSGTLIAFINLKAHWPGLQLALGIMLIFIGSFIVLSLRA